MSDLSNTKHTAPLARCGPVALLGAGNIGAAMARRLASCGADLLVCDLDPARLAGFDNAGIKTTQSARDCGTRVKTAIIVVASEPQLTAVIDGLLEAPSPRSLSNIVIMSTVSADAITAAARKLAPLDIGLVEAPVSGGANPATAGTLTIMLGGEHVEIAKVRPFIDCLGSNIFHCGSLGSAQQAKILNNILCHANIALMAEVMQLGYQIGIGPETLLPIMEVSTGRNFLTVEHPRTIAHFTAIASSRPVFDGILAITHKDLHMASALARSSPGSYPMIQGLDGLVDTLGDETYENWQAAFKNLSR